MAKSEAAKKRDAEKKKAARAQAAQTKAETAPSTSIAPRTRVIDGDGIRRPEDIEMSSYAGSISALDEFERATGGIPDKNLDSELLDLRNRWRRAKPGVLERFDRFNKRRAA